MNVQNLSRLRSLAPQPRLEGKAPAPPAFGVDTVELSGGSAPLTEFQQRYGPWGVVTGASQGIGAEYARALAEKGLNVVLVARSADKLERLSSELSQQYGVKVKVVAADLGSEAGIDTVRKATDSLQVGLLVNNAGTWQFGRFLDNDVAKENQVLALNAKAPMALTHHFANRMATVGHGGILNVGSGAALHGVPGQASYSTSKGFIRNFTEALHHELKPKGIDVLITNPGPVEGDAASVYDQSKIPLPKVTGRQVAVESLDRLQRGQASTIPGWLSRVSMSLACRLMPRDLLGSIAGYILEQASTPKPEKPLPAPLSSPEARGATQKNPFLRDFGPWGVVTGASQGLGEEYAEQLASRGMNVVLVARNQEKLEAEAHKLEEKYGIQARVVPADLARPEGVAAVEQQTRDLDVGLLVNNAGTWQFGDFLRNDVATDLRSIDLNVVAPMDLAHEFGTRMAARGGGAILNVGSGAALHGVPGQAAYSATKGALQNLTESLHLELKSKNVQVMITDPGPIIGEASSVYDQSKLPMQKLKAHDVVADSLDHLRQRGSTRIPGWFNRLASTVAIHLLGRDTMAGVAGYLIQRASAQ